MTREGVLADVRACVEQLRASGGDRVGMVGLSLGGHVAYLAATALDLAAVAVFYGGWLRTTTSSRPSTGAPSPTRCARRAPTTRWSSTPASGTASSAPTRPPRPTPGSASTPC